MKTRNARPDARISRAAVVCLILIAAVATTIAAEQYRVGPGDELEIRFWQDPRLNSQVRVSLDGTIALDIVGTITVAGKTTNEIQSDIVRRISSLNTQVSQAVVRVVTYDYQHVFVTGQVGSPGRFAYEQIPDLWSVINDAGGPTRLADLTRVTIIRGEGEDAGRIEVVDVADAIATQSLNSLPSLSRKDRVDLPSNLFGQPSADIGPQREARNVIYVMGAVTQPGPIQYDQNIDVLEAIAIAAGPAANADLKNTRIITKDSRYGQSVHIDLEEYTSSGHPVRYVLSKEDMVYVPARGGGFFRGTLPVLGATAGVVTTVLLLLDRIND
jgi:polysaccharide export outer membrane protein